jgi:hypothetical protein
MLHSSSLAAGLRPPRANIAKINNAGVITEAKAVKGSEPFGITVPPE